MVRDNTRINLKRENQPLVEYMPISSPTKCIACSLDRYRGALYPIFIIFACVFAFISTLKGGCRVCTIDCCVVSNGFFWRELFYAGGHMCAKKIRIFQNRPFEPSWGGSSFFRPAFPIAPKTGLSHDDVIVRCLSFAITLSYVYLFDDDECAMLFI
jgi:hypothetical protein